MVALVVARAPFGFAQDRLRARGNPADAGAEPDRHAGCSPLAMTPMFTGPSYPSPPYPVR
jgi:hypothetical protein